MNTDKAELERRMRRSALKREIEELRIEIASSKKSERLLTSGCEKRDLILGRIERQKDALLAKERQWVRGESTDKLRKERLKRWERQLGVRAEFISLDPTYPQSFLNLLLRRDELLKSLGTFSTSGILTALNARKAQTEQLEKKLAATKDELRLLEHQAVST